MEERLCIISMTLYLRLLQFPHRIESALQAACMELSSHRSCFKHSRQLANLLLKGPLEKMP